uniref:Uncharacterized protein MANES_04G142700 n=1 Tax=Rhizophora mucronata TaxID=61149 RepID=A0A2P2MIY4_RHIMU
MLHEKEFAIILKMARTTKDVSYRGQKAESVGMAPSKTLIIPGKDVVQVIAKDVIVTMDGICRELQRERQQELLLGSFISQSRQIEAERELEPWVPDEDDPQCPELENIFDGPRNRMRQSVLNQVQVLLFILQVLMIMQTVKAGYY